MATYLADTNLLLRMADPASALHPIATQALARLFGQGDEVFLTPQTSSSSGPLPRALLKQTVLVGTANEPHAK